MLNICEMAKDTAIVTIVIVPFSVTLSDPIPRFQDHDWVIRPIDALDVLCGQLTRDLFAIAKFLFFDCSTN